MNDDYEGSYKEAFQNFIKYYAPDIIVPSASKKPKLIPRRDRKCRFCGKSCPDVSFKRDAHVLPQFMGNRYLIHDIECDKCNSRFSRYESSFADSIGMIRTTDRIRGQNGIPKFKKDGIVAFSELSHSGEEIIIIESSSNLVTQLNEENKSLVITARKSPYVPLHVMKVLFKIGYSIIEDKELHEYAHIEKIVNTDELDTRLNEYCKVLKFTFNYSYAQPTVVAFRKRAEFACEQIPTRLILLYFGRFMYEFIMLNSMDDFMIKKGGKGRTLFIPPYIQPGQPLPGAAIVDFSGVDPVTETEQYHFVIENDSVNPF